MSASLAQGRLPGKRQDSRIQSLNSSLRGRPVADRAIFAQSYRLWDRGFLLASSLGCLERIFRLGLMGIAGSRLTKLRRSLSSFFNSLSSRSLSQIAVTATINNIRTATPTAKVKPWTSKIILENYTLKRALPAHAPVRPPFEKIRVLSVMKFCQLAMN